MIYGQFGFGDTPTFNGGQFSHNMIKHKSTIYGRWPWQQPMTGQQPSPQPSYFGLPNYGTLPSPFKSPLDRFRDPEFGARRSQFGQPPVMAQGPRGQFRVPEPMMARPSMPSPNFTKSPSNTGGWRNPDGSWHVRTPEEWASEKNKPSLLGLPAMIPGKMTL